jgi:putative transposase
MKRSKFGEEQVLAILREQEAGAKTADVCRRHGVSSATFYAWKAKYGGMDVSETKRLKALEAENAKLKRLYADAMLDNAGLKELLADNQRFEARRSLWPSSRRSLSARASPDHALYVGPNFVRVNSLYVSTDDVSPRRFVLTISARVRGVPCIKAHLAAAPVVSIEILEWRIEKLQDLT